MASESEPTYDVPEPKAITLASLDALLLEGWAIRGVDGLVEFRDPFGDTGWDYRCDNLADDFPPVVAQWIAANIIEKIDDDVDIE